MHKINFKNILVGLGSAVIILTSLYVGLFSDASSLGPRNTTSSNLSTTNNNNIDQTNSLLAGSELVHLYTIVEVDPDKNKPGPNPEPPNPQYVMNIKRTDIGNTTAGIMVLYDNDYNIPPISKASTVVFRNEPYYVEEVSTINHPEGLDVYNTSSVCKFTSTVKKVNRVRYITGTGRKTPVFTIGSTEEVVCTFTNTRK